MIINGGSRRAGGWWGKHLENAEQNERVTLAEIAGLDATAIPDLLHEMEILAQNSGSKAKNYFYQANVNPREGEILTPDQRHEAKELLLKNLGLADQPHFVVEHEKQGRVHFHVIALRIDMEQGKAISDSLTAQIHERTARELEIRFDLERGKSVLVAERDTERPERGAKKHEIFRGAQGGIDPDVVKADARRAWEQADSGATFKAALEASGDYVLARGDRRDFVIIDRAGDDHSLARRLGEKVKAVRERMADLDPASLPGVEQAKELQRERHAEREPEPSVIKEPANENINTPMTLDAITHDPWQAVYLAVPDNADRTLLAAVATCADQCAKFAFAAARVSEVIQPELKEYCQDRQTDALTRRNEARAALEALPPEQVATVSPFLHPEQLHDRAMAGLRDAVGERAAEMGLIGQINQHWLDQNPWNAVTQPLPLPIHASSDFFHRVFDLSVQFALEALDRETAAYTPAEAKLWDVVRGDAEQRMLEALVAERTAKELLSRAEAWLGKGRYDDLRQAQKEAVATPPRQPDMKEEFWAAATNTEPAAPVFDRDAAEAAWQRELIDRAAAQAEQEARTAAHGRKDDTRGPTAERHSQEQHRPASRIESRIADCAEQAERHGAVVLEDANGRRVDRVEALADYLRPEDERQTHTVSVQGRDAFAARLEEAGIVIARVTEADVTALASLREQEKFDRESGLAHRPHHFAELSPGELAAITRNGDVHCINPDKLGAAKQFLDLAADLPGVVETRTRLQIEGEKITALWDQQRAAVAEARQDFAAERENQAQHTQTVRDVRQFNQEIGDVADTGVRATGRFLGSVGKIFEGVIGFIADSIAPPPPPTPEQAERMARSAEDQREARADQAAQAEREEQHWLVIEAQKKAREREEAEAEQESAHRRKQDRDYERER